MKKILLSVRPKYCELIFNGKKTIEVRDRIKILMGGGTRSLELFAREQVEGWDCWGDEV